MNVFIVTCISLDIFKLVFKLNFSSTQVDTLLKSLMFLCVQCHYKYDNGEEVNECLGLFRYKYKKVLAVGMHM